MSLNNKNCLDPTWDTCVVWTGDDMPFFGIKSGEKYSVAIVKLAQALQDYVEQNVSLKCLYDDTCGNCEPVVRIPAAVEVIIDYLCAFTTDNVTNVGDLECLGNSSLSPDAAKFINTPFRYVVTPSTSGATISFDYLEAVSNIPSGYSLGGVRTKVTGSANNGSTIIGDSNKSYYTTTVKSERFPLNANLEVNVLTPSGNVKLTRNVTITGTESKEYSGVLSINDFSSKDTKVFTQTQVNELVASAVCQVISELDQLKNIDVDSTDCVQFASKDIKDVVSALAGALQDLCDRVKKLETVTTTGPGCGACGESKTAKSPEQAIEECAQTNCSQAEEISQMQEQLTTLAGQLSSFVSSQTANGQ